MPSRAWRNRDETFEIRWDYASGGITYDEEFDEDWTVVDLATGQKLNVFRGAGRKDYPSTYRGVKGVEFGRDGYVVIATHHDGNVERMTLPDTGGKRPWWRSFWRWGR